MEHEEAHCQTQANQQNITNNPVHYARDEYMGHARNSNNDNSSRNE